MNPTDYSLNDFENFCKKWVRKFFVLMTHGVEL